MSQSISRPSIPLVLVAAVARNGVIGNGNALPWRLSSDLKRFKALTLGKPMIMGRKTFESIGKPLPGRETIVVTRDSAFRPSGVHTVATIPNALDLAHDRAQALGAQDIIIAGGGEIYAQTIAVAERLEITHVEIETAGDARFPIIDTQIWRETWREVHSASPTDEAAFAFVRYERS